MATNIPLTGKFKVTCIFKKKGKNWSCGFHTGIDLISDNKDIYSSCDGIVYKTGWDDSYGNYIVVKNSDGKYHWFCHLAKIKVRAGDKVSRTDVIGIMGNTGNSTGKHLHFEIRNKSNKYADNSNPASYMGIDNKVGSYNSEDYQLDNSNSNSKKELKTLARNTNLRNKPTTKGSTATLYLENTTLYILEKSVAKADGYTWDKVKIRVTGDEGYMINQNYK